MTRGPHGAEEISGLAASLFALATAVMEEAHETAVQGQAPGADIKDLAIMANALKTTAQQLDAIAEIVLALSGDD